MKLIMQKSFNPLLQPAIYLQDAFTAEKVAYSAPVMSLLHTTVFQNSPFWDASSLPIYLTPTPETWGHFRSNFQSSARSCCLGRRSRNLCRCLKIFFRLQLQNLNQWFPNCGLQLTSGFRANFWWVMRPSRQAFCASWIWWETWAGHTSHNRNLNVIEWDGHWLWYPK